MNGLLVALTLVVGIITGHGGDVNENTVSTTSFTPTTTTVPLASHQVVQDLDKCNKIAGMDERNLCYAQASRDSFFCDRIADHQLKNECYLKIQ